MAPVSSSNHPIVGLASLGCGAFILLLATDVIPPEPDSVHAPRWVFGLCGLALAACGGALLGARWPVVRAISLSIVLLGLGGVAAWATVAPAEGWSGGLPLVPPAVNVAIARGLAGLGALCCLGLLLYGWKTGFRSAEDASRRGRSGP